MLTSIVNHYHTGEALGAIGNLDIIPLLEEYSKDPVIEVAETCQLALDRLTWLKSNEETKNSYSTIDPAPPTDSTNIPSLRELLINENASLFDRYRAMFSLRNLCTDESISALGESELPIKFQFSPFYINQS